jgi:hypothetical protein
MGGTLRVQNSENMSMSMQYCSFQICSSMKFVEQISNFFALWRIIEANSFEPLGNVFLT